MWARFTVTPAARENLSLGHLCFKVYHQKGEKLSVSTPQRRVKCENSRGNSRVTGKPFESN